MGPRKSTLIESSLEDFMEHFARLKNGAADFSTLTEELRNLHQNPEEYWYAMGSRLRRIVNERLYLTDNYSSFSDFCARGLVYSRQHNYKMMRIVKFIDELWAQAKTLEKQKIVYRLFMLGLSKLYILHSLPAPTLEHLLQNGVAWIVGESQSVTLIPLEAATIGQLRRYLAQRIGKKPKKQLSTNGNPAATSTHATAIVQGIDALTGGPLRSISTTVLVIESNDELFILLDEVFSRGGIKTLRARSVEEAKQNFNGGFDFAILHADEAGLVPARIPNRQ